MNNQHWIDELVQWGREELREVVRVQAEALHDSVPVGMRPLGKQEQLQKFEGMLPEEHDELKAEIGEEQYGQYLMAQVENARQLHGDAYAAQLMNNVLMPIAAPEME